MSKLMQFLGKGRNTRGSQRFLEIGGCSDLARISGTAVTLDEEEGLDTDLFILQLSQYAQQSLNL